jgi:adenylate kinase
MLKILFLGMPGSGKGTQAELLSKFGLKHISTGELIREAFKKQDPLVIPYREKVEAGNFVPDEIVFMLTKKNIGNFHGKGYILDGAARNVEQAKFNVEKNIIDEVIFFTLNDEDAVKRLSSRLVCENCGKIYTHREKKCKACNGNLIRRKDDAPEIIRERLKIFKRDTFPVADYLKKHLKKYYEIDASKSIEEIHENVLRVLGL